MKFEKYSISHQIKNSLEKMGYKRPTDIQFKAIPPILKGEDVLGIAQTGTGKTAAFVIPVLHLLLSRKVQKRKDGIKCIVMVPTRELAMQITGVFQKIGQFTKINSFCVFGGVEQGPQITKLEKGIDVLVATPGRMFDLVSQGYIRLNRVEILILDEADHMLDLGFIKDIRDLIKHLPQNRQTLFFSATIDEKIKKLAYSLVKNPIRIEISPKDPVSRNVDHSVAFIEMDDKRFFLERLINENSASKILVFVRTKVRAERVAKAMGRVNIEAYTLHGDKEQKERLTLLSQFKNDKFKVLIATDVSARGIDIPNVDYVINYDLPDQAENYVHRVGRTGRGVHKGTAVSFCSKEEIEMLKEIEGFINNTINVLEISKSDYRDTLDFTSDHDDNWKRLLKEQEEGLKMRRKKKKR